MFARLLLRPSVASLTGRSELSMFRASPEMPSNADTASRFKSTNWVSWLFSMAHWFRTLSWVMKFLPVPLAAEADSYDLILESLWPAHSVSTSDPSNFCQLAKLVESKMSPW